MESQYNFKEEGVGMVAVFVCLGYFNAVGAEQAYRYTEEEQHQQKREEKTPRPRGGWRRSVCIRIYILGGRDLLNLPFFIFMIIYKNKNMLLA